ncbi:MAG TPA: FeoB-associated Cys-rich membrane protein [Clostridiales bacterium]|nr:FeoB-associated Cys-rich membrane protein [Clostridiales bacterium]
MLSWITANLANIIPLLLIAAAVVLVVRKMIKNKKSGASSCGCGCSGCAMSDTCHPKAAPPGSQK